MSTYTPRVPPQPHSTPAAHPDASRRTTRAPILNPYDKFNQTDFDSWIGGITGALRHALGQAEVQESPFEKKIQQPVLEPVYQDVNAETDQDEEYFEDSFAEIKMRREISKGKARDPREGPGFSDGWNKEEPIEILSDSEDEGAGNPRLNRGGGGSEGEDAGYGFEEGGDEQEAQNIQRRYSPHDEEYSDEEGSFEDEANLLEGSPERDHRRSSIDRSPEIYTAEADGEEDYEEEYEEYEGSELERSASPAPRVHPHPVSEVIDLESDEEEIQQEVSDDEPEEPEPRSSPFYAVADDDGYYEGDEEDQLQDEESHIHAVGGDEDDGFQLERDDEDDETHPLEDTTSFPPVQFEPSVDERPDIRDHGSAPRVNGEDFYSAGPSLLQKSQLNADDLENIEIPAPLLEESSEVLHDDSEFLPEDPGDLNESSPTVELRDVWEGPSVYAEDFYSGGDFKHLAEEILDPDHLGSEQAQAGPEIIDLDANFDSSNSVPSAFSATQTAMDLDEPPSPIHESMPAPAPEFEASQYEAHDGLPDTTPQELPDAQGVSVENEYLHDQPPTQLNFGAAETDDQANGIWQETSQSMDLSAPSPSRATSEGVKSGVLPELDFELEYPHGTTPLEDIAAEGGISSHSDITATKRSKDLMEGIFAIPVVVPEVVDSVREEISQRNSPEFIVLDDSDEEESEGTGSFDIVEDMEEGELQAQEIQEVDDEATDEFAELRTADDVVEATNEPEGDEMVEEHQEGHVVSGAEEVYDRSPEDASINFEETVDSSAEEAQNAVIDVDDMIPEQALDDVQEIDLGPTRSLAFSDTEDLSLDQRSETALGHMGIGETAAAEGATDHSQEEAGSLATEGPSGVAFEHPLNEAGVRDDLENVLVTGDTDMVVAVQSSGSEEVAAVVEQSHEEAAHHYKAEVGVSEEDDEPFIASEGANTIIVAEDAVIPEKAAGGQLHSVIGGYSDYPDRNTCGEEVDIEIFSGRSPVQLTLFKFDGSSEQIEGVGEAELATQKHHLTDIDEPPCENPEGLPSESHRSLGDLAERENSETDEGVVEASSQVAAVDEHSMDTGVTAEGVSSPAPVVVSIEESEASSRDAVEDYSMASDVLDETVLGSAPHEDIAASSQDTAVGEHVIMPSDGVDKMALDSTVLEIAAAAPVAEVSEKIPSTPSTTSQDHKLEGPSEVPTTPIAIVDENISNDPQLLTSAEIEVATTSEVAMQFESPIPRPAVPLFDVNESRTPPQETPVIIRLHDPKAASSGLPTTIKGEEDVFSINGSLLREDEEGEGGSGGGTGLNDNDLGFSATAAPQEEIRMHEPEASGEPVELVQLPLLGLADPYPASLSTPFKLDFPQPASLVPFLPGPSAPQEERARVPQSLPTNVPHPTGEELNRQEKIISPPDQLLDDGVLYPPSPHSLSPAHDSEINTQQAPPPPHEPPSPGVKDPEPVSTPTPLPPPNPRAKSLTPVPSKGIVDTADLFTPRASDGTGVNKAIIPSVSEQSDDRAQILSEPLADAVEVSNAPSEPQVAHGTMAPPAIAIPSHPQSPARLSTSGGKRKRGDLSPKKGARVGHGSTQKSSRKKLTKGKDKLSSASFDGPLDGGEEIHVKPRNKTKLQEHVLSSMEGTGRPPVSTSASVKSGSSASSAARLLQPNGSRASSIVSAASEISEQQSQPSPTTHKPTTSKSKAASHESRRGVARKPQAKPKSKPKPLDLTPRGWQHRQVTLPGESQFQSPPNPPSMPFAKPQGFTTTPPAQRQEPPSLFHAHGKNRKAMQLQYHHTLPAHTQLQPSPLHVNIVRFPTLDASSEQPSLPPIPPATLQAGPSSQSEAAETPTAHTSHTHTPITVGRRSQSMKTLASNSPITRSHCRFHKISIPRDEAGPRIFFIVPGCSLTKPNIIEEEEIEDHGDATYDDSTRMVDNIESLGFEPYLIAVLKSLVGSDIMQSHDIYYLPLEGETLTRNYSSFTHSLASSSRGPTSVAKEGQRVDLGISETESEGDSCFSDPDYEESQPAPKRSKAAGRKGKAVRTEGSVGRRSGLIDPQTEQSQPPKSSKRPRTSSTHESLQMDDVPEAKKVKLDVTQ